MSDSKKILEVKNLSIDFAIDGNIARAVDGMSFEVSRGEVLAIVGESGSGKSTTAMSLVSLLPRNSRTTGSATLHGQQLVGMSIKELRKVRGKQVAFIFQEPMTALNPVFTVGFQIVEALREHFNTTRAAAKERALELLAMVELPDPEKAFDSYPHQLSGGQRQRAMIAQSISCDPDILIADEPTTALDVTVQAEILDLMRSLKDRLDSAIILITHDMGVVADMADRMIVMKDGIAVESGTADQIFNAPRHPYTQRLLASVPHLGTGKPAETIGKQAKSVLSAKNIVIEYPKRGRVPAFRAVDDITIEIGEGEVLGLVGESGSGKTTVGRALVGLLPVHSGTVTMGDKVFASDEHGFKINKDDLREFRRNLGIVFQDPGSSLNPRWPVGQSIAEPMELSKEFTAAQIEARVIELLDQVQLPTSYRNRYPHELSGGQRQRVGIARALALRPKLLIADEPTSALDVSVQASVLELFQDLQKDLGFACLFISHDLAVVDLLSDRIAVMQHGRIVEQGPKEQILRNPQEEYTKRLLAAVPVPNPEEQKIRRLKRLELQG